MRSLGNPTVRNQTEQGDQASRMKKNSCIQAKGLVFIDFWNDFRNFKFNYSASYAYFFYWDICDFSLNCKIFSYIKDIDSVIYNTMLKFHTPHLSFVCFIYLLISPFFCSQIDWFLNVLGNALLFFFFKCSCPSQIY